MTDVNGHETHGMQWGTDLPSNKNDPGKTGTLRSPENF